MQVLKTHIVKFKTERGAIVTTVIYQCPNDVWYINFPTYNEKLEANTFKLLEMDSEAARAHINEF